MPYLREVQRKHWFNGTTDKDEKEYFLYIRLIPVIGFRFNYSEFTSMHMLFTVHFMVSEHLQSRKEKQKWSSHPMPLMFPTNHPWMLHTKNFQVSYQVQFLCRNCLNHLKTFKKTLLKMKSLLLSFTQQSRRLSRIWSIPLLPVRNTFKT